MPTDWKIKNELKNKKKRKEPTIVEAVKAAVVFKMSWEESNVEFPGGSMWASGGSLPYKHDLSSLETASCVTESTPTIPWKSSQ